VLDGGREDFKGSEFATLLVRNARCLALARPGVLSLISRVGSHVRTSLDASEIFALVFPACTADTPTYWLTSAKNNALRGAMIIGRFTWLQCAKMLQPRVTEH
jgi:hypothetical protein